MVHLGEDMQQMPDGSHDTFSRMAEDPLDDFEREALKYPPLSPADKRALVSFAALLAGTIESVRWRREIQRGSTTLQSRLTKSAIIGASMAVGAVSFAQSIRLEGQEAGPEIETDH